MRILIKRAVIIDPLSKHHGKKRDIYIAKGRIEEIGRNLDLKADSVVKAGNLHVSQGWCDIGSQIGEPGYEHRETIQSVSRAATAGGYTTIAPFPNTNPVLDNRSSIEYVINRARETAVHVAPIGAITEGARGENIAELQDMTTGGAVAFSDGRTALQHTGVMLIALQYVRKFNGLIINRPFVDNLVAGGQMHESAVSTSLGMRGFPPMSESIMLSRDLKLLEYSDSRLHAFGISSTEAVEVLKNAVKAKLAVSASVPAANLYLTDEDLMDFDTNYKVLPPLRENADRKALVRGVKRGIISCIVSNHEPYEEEQKKLEFAHAEFGSTGLQTAFGMANASMAESLSIDEIIHCFTAGPRDVLGLINPVIEKGGLAELTLFDPALEWSMQIDQLISKSKNSAGLGLPLRGKALATVNKGLLHQTV